MKDFFRYAIIMGGLLGLLGLCVWVFDRESSTVPLTPSQTERADFEPLVPMTLGGAAVYASVADTLETRERGLSRTTALPPDVVKLFVFPNENTWSFWMKEMQYAIDIIWINAGGQIVHIEERVLPETYPTAFAPDAPARYVIETNAGFVANNFLKVGDTVTLPKY